MVSTTMVSSSDVNAGGLQHQQHHDVPYSSPPNIMAPEFHPAHMPPDCAYYPPPPESFYCTPDGYPHPMCQLNTEYGKVIYFVQKDFTLFSVSISELLFSRVHAVFM